METHVDGSHFYRLTFGAQTERCDGIDDNCNGRGDASRRVFEPCRSSVDRRGAPRRRRSKASSRSEKATSQKLEGGLR
jgi:hypothetical protein